MESQYFIDKVKGKGYRRSKTSTAINAMIDVETNKLQIRSPQGAPLDGRPHIMSASAPTSLVVVSQKRCKMNRRQVAIGSLIYALSIHAKSTTLDDLERHYALSQVCGCDSASSI